MVGRGLHRLVGLLSVLLLPAASFGVEVSVCRDATYDIPSSRGIVCSGSGATPAGNACPRKGDRANKDCRSGLPSFAGSTCLAKEDARCSRVAGGVWGCVFPSSGCAGLATATAKMTCPSWEDTSEDGYYTEGLVEIGSGRRLQALEETDVPDSWFEMETEPTEIGACDDPPTRSPTPSPATSRPPTTSTPIPSVNPSSTPVTAASTPITPPVPTSSMPATGTAPTPSPSSEPLPPVVIIEPTPVPSPSSNGTEPLPPVVIIDPTPVPSPTPIVTLTLPPCSDLEPIDFPPGDDSNTTMPHPPAVTPNPEVSEQPVATPTPTPSATATLPPCSDLEPIDFPPGDSTGPNNPIALPSVGPGPGYTDQPTPATTSTETPGAVGPIVIPPIGEPGSGLTEEPAPVPTNTETPGPVGLIVIPPGRGTRPRID